MTIKEIARMAGVSNAAVSRYLNGGSLSLEKRRRIGEVIARTGYSPSSFARAMRTKQSYQLGVILPSIQSESGPRIVSGISSALDGSGYHFILADTEEDIKKELHYLELFQNSHLDGLILVASTLTGGHREIFSDLKLPLVILGQKVDGFPCIFHRDQDAAFDMMSLLLSSGCSHPAFLGVSETDPAAGLERKKGVLKALSAAGISSSDCIFSEALFTTSSGEEKAFGLFSLHPEIDGIFCATDLIAVGAMKAAAKAGKRIPQDLHLCGIGDHPMSEMIPPGLTTAHYHYYTSGQMAARLLLNLIKNPRKPPVSCSLGYQIIRRGTL